MTVVDSATIHDIDQTQTVSVLRPVFLHFHATWWRRVCYDILARTLSSQLDWLRWRGGPDVPPQKASLT
jgi:hypothetical protein